MRVIVDRVLCQVHAQCVFAAPEVFELDDDDQLVYVAEPDDGLIDAVEEAARACPVQAIFLEEA
ncbi:ferredoxin [Streptosporangium roseum]|uniref:Ferredoxin n=1 Tax=Streptosporangium roseum (strain ATCC 12428 / DSM 43021 / JCM 3005 / KCTC 9067 / NCIMB 10171 / NRRL 2505 / NI 9100) TaxID=479432 RepID=D2BCX9_STRRD|nr:ferredoxin [Streptosporangium roseum]ACZ84220.1 ferredoxin reductase [Streptosporangium roseum DSM 43021]